MYQVRSINGYVYIPEWSQEGYGFLKLYHIMYASSQIGFQWVCYLIRRPYKVYVFMQNGPAKTRVLWPPSYYPYLFLNGSTSQEQDVGKLYISDHPLHSCHCQKSLYGNYHHEHIIQNVRHTSQNIPIKLPYHVMQSEWVEEPYQNPFGF